MKVLTKKTILFFIISFFFTDSSLLFADPVHKSDAAFAARNFYENKNPVRNSDFVPPGLDRSQASSRARSILSGEEETLHLFEFEGGGYIIMSADDNAPPILGYSFDGDQINDEVPPQLEAMLEEYDLQGREHGRTRTDAQGQREKRHRSEARCAPQTA